MSKIKNKKLCVLIGAFLVSVIMVGIMGLVNFKSVNAASDITEFSSEITAVSHANGEIVCILPEEVRLLNESEKFDSDYLNGLYEYSDLHREFTSVINYDNERLVEVYREADAFNPVNNVLRWRSSLENVKSYTVRVAYDNKFTQCILKVTDADIDNGVVIENPLVDTAYYWQVIATLDDGKDVYSPVFDFTTAKTLRTVTIDGVSNTRDIGGYETAYGYVRQGLIYRSARLETITEDGLKTLKTSLGVKTELDLRGEEEIASTPINKKNAANLDNCFVYATPQYAYAGDVGIDSNVNVSKIKNIMTVFTDKENYPIVFHCAVGRDRTGTVAAILKAVLGYSEQDIINDYFTSMFATTGAWGKSFTYTNKDMAMNILLYLNSFNGATLADRAADYLISKCGMTQSDIDAIRDIMTGKVDVEIPLENTFADTDNYAEYAFVTFEKFGTAKETKVVRCGETVDAPFDAGDGYVWTLGKDAYDFASAVENDMTIKALETKSYEIEILSSGAINSRETVTVNGGDKFDFSALQKDGYDFTVVSEDGKVIPELTVVGKSTINVIYFEK